MFTIVFDWDEQDRIMRVGTAPDAASAAAALAGAIQAGNAREDAFAFESDACWRDVTGWVVNPENQTAVYTPPAPVVPQAVTPLQARKALRQAGLMSAVQGYIATQSEEVQEEWDYALEIRRDNPTLLAAASALELTTDQIDALFIAAAAIEN